MFCNWCLPHGHKHKRFNLHAIKQRLHGSWNTIHSRHDMHTQQRSVHAHHQQEAVAYPHAELLPFSRMLWCSVYCIITFAKQQDIVFVGDDPDRVHICVLSDIGLKRIYFHTESKSNFPDPIGIDYKCSKLSVNISINTYYMYMLYLLVIHTSKEFGTYHEAEILSFLLQVSIYPIIRRGKSEENCKIQQKSPVAFYGGQWLIGQTSSAAVLSESVLRLCAFMQLASHLW